MDPLEAMLAISLNLPDMIPESIGKKVGMATDGEETHDEPSKQFR